MKPNPTRSALLVIDMENGFVHPEGGHWIRFAQSMVPNCVRAVELARAKGIPVFFVKRLYRADGSDVELTRYPGWVAGGLGYSASSRASMTIFSALIRAYFLSTDSRMCQGA